MVLNHQSCKTNTNALVIHSISIIKFMKVFNLIAVLTHLHKLNAIKKTNCIHIPRISVC